MISSRKVFIASDHAGYELKEAIKRSLHSMQWVDLGPLNGDESVDYPDFAAAVAAQVLDDENSLGILICGSGIGMSIAANKVPGVRAAVVENPVGARLSREHNDANILCLGSRFLAPEYGAEIARVWLEASFTGEPRHAKRIRKIAAIESKKREER